MRQCKGCSTKDEHIKDLREQVEWLRVQLGTPLLTQGVEEREKLERLWTTEDEDDITYMTEAGLIPAYAAEQALAQLGALSTDVTIEEF